jgi:hypothetical protein
MRDEFKQYFMFRPTDDLGNPLPGSIWVTLGKANWDWLGAIFDTPSGWDWGSREFYHSQSVQPSTEFPEWTQIKVNF